MPDDLDARVRERRARVLCENVGCSPDEAWKGTAGYWTCWSGDADAIAASDRAADVAERIALMVSHARDFTLEQKREAAMALLEGSGFVVVPKKPNGAMADAAWRSCDVTEDQARFVWCVMLDAAERSASGVEGE